MQSKVFDVHVHIYPENLAERAAAAIVDFYSEFEVEAHGAGSLADCIKKCDAAGTTMFAAHSVAVRPHSARRICDFIMDAHDRYPDKVVPFAAIHPDMEDPDGFAWEMKERGFRGFKIHPDMQRFALDGKDAEPMMRAIAKTGLPVLTHCGDARYDFDGPVRALSLREKIPELKMIAAHFGGWLQWNEAVSLLPGSGITVDLSSSLYKWPPERAIEVIRIFGAENILYGSDYPMWDPKEELCRFMNLPLTDEEKNLILWKNAADMFDLEKRSI